MCSIDLNIIDCRIEPLPSNGNVRVCLPFSLWNQSFMYEFVFLFLIYSISELFVESAEFGPERIPVHLNISLVRLKCEGN